MAEDNYKFIEEKIKPKKKRIVKERFKKFGKLIGSGAIFGVAAAISAVLVYNLMGGIQFSETPIKTVEEAGPEKTNPPENLQDTPKKNGNKSEKSDLDDISVSDYALVHQKVFEYAKLYEDTIVTVAKVTEGVDCFQNPIENSDSFSGVVIRVDNKNIYILTEYDGLKVNSAYEIYFRSGESTQATVLGVDRETGLAVISASLEDLSADMLESVRKAVLGKSSDVNEGDFVVAIGNPAGNMYSIIDGVVLTKPITKYIADRQVSLFHTDMICIDNGGGVVMNTQGNVVGIITHRFENEDHNMLSFIGISEIEDLLDILINNRRMPYMGIVASNISQEYMVENDLDYGIYITEVKAGSPAAEANLSAGDIVVSVAGEPIDSVMKYTEILASRYIGEEIEVEIFRPYAKQDERRTLEIVLTESKR